MDELKEKLDGGYRDESKAVAEEQGRVKLEDIAQGLEEKMRGYRFPTKRIYDVNKTCTGTRSSDD